MEQNVHIPPGTPVLVTGATGFTGSRLIRKLVEQGLDVRALARESSNTDALNGLPVTWFRGDVFDEEAVRPAMDGVQYVFHLAAVYRQTNVSKPFYHKVHVNGTQVVARLAREVPGFKRFVHVSTIGVHGHIRNPPADENYRFEPDDLYQQTKADAEKWFHDYAIRNGLPYVIVRPCAIYGPGDTRLLKIFKMAARKVCPILGRRPCHYHLIHVDDLTEILIRAAVHPRAQGEVFIAGNPQSLPLDRIIHIIAQSLDHPVRIIRLPAWPFVIAAYLCEGLCRPFGIEPPIHRRRVAFYTKDRSFDTRKLREQLAYRVRYSNEEGLARTARWYVDNGYIAVEPS